MTDTIANARLTSVQPCDQGRNAGATEKLAQYMQELHDGGKLDGYSFFFADNREAHPEDFAASVHSLLKADVEGKGIDVTEEVLNGGLI
jgi:hypothetical protein